MKAMNTPRNRDRALGWFLLVLLLPGCAAQSGFSRSFPKRLTEAQNEWHFRFGRSFNAQAALPAQSPAPPAAPLDAWHLQALLDRLVYVSPLRGYAVRVQVVNDPKLNAFTDGQTITITTGLMMVFQYREDVMASVMAHELGHILAHHLPDQKSRNIAMDYLSYLTPALSALPYGGYYSSAAGTAIREGAKVRRFSYDRLQETEADVIGVYLAAKAGYGGMGLSEFLDVAKSSGFGPPQSISIPTSLGTIPASAATLLLSTSPLYRIHPPSAKRKRIVELMQARCQGKLAQAELRKQSAWMADLYAALEMRSPKA